MSCVRSYLNNNQYIFMNKPILIGLMAVSSLLFLLPMVSATQLIQNGNFETNYDYWTKNLPFGAYLISDNSTRCLSGNCSELIGDSCTNCYNTAITQYMNVTGSQFHVFFEYSTVGSNVAAFIYNSTTTTTLLNTGSNCGSDKCYYSHTFPDNEFLNQNISINLYCDGSEGSCFFDNVSATVDAVSYSSCYDINTSGTYSILQNITADKSPCITISASNVIFNMGNHLITINEGETGILVNNANNVVLEYGRIQSLPTGHGDTIVLNHSNSVVLNNIYSVGNVRLYSSNYSIIEGSILGGGDFGSYITEFSNNNIIGNSGFYNPYGMIYLESGTFNNRLCNIVYGESPYKADYGTNNTYSASCPPGLTTWNVIQPPCTGFTGRKCVSIDQYADIDIWCNYNNIVTCPYGCDYATNDCKGAVSVSSCNWSDLTALTNLSCIFSNTRGLIIFIMIDLATAGFVAYKIRKDSGIIFITVFISGLVIGSIIKINGISIVPMWIPIILVVICGLIAFKLFGGGK